jgi:diacylglycerol kinase (ATP)
MSTHAVVLLNPQAGVGKARALRQPMQHWLLRHAPGVPLLAPDSAEAARATLMVMAPRTRVVMVGGDGTLHNMLPALLRCGHRVGLVAGGRCNELANVLGVAALRWEEALRYALHAPVQALDVAQIDADQAAFLFITRLAVGHDAQLDQHRLHVPGWLGQGSWAERWAGLRASLHSPPFDLRLWINGRLQHDASALGVVISNTPDPSHHLPSSLIDACLETRVRATTGRHALLWARSGPLALGVCRCTGAAQPRS